MPGIEIQQVCNNSNDDFNLLRIKFPSRRTRLPSWGTGLISPPAKWRGNISGQQGRAGKLHKAAGFAGGRTRHKSIPKRRDQTLRFCP